MTRPAISARFPGLLNPTTVILVCVASLCALGLTVLYSASAASQSDPYFYLKRQLLWLALSASAAFVVSRLDLEAVRRHVWVISGVALVLLVLVLIPHIGISVKGSRRWLGLGPARLQVSELAKLALVFSLAHYLAVSQARIPEFVRGFAAPAAWIGLFAGLIFLEPDFGTAFLTGSIGLAMMLLAGARLRYLLPSAAAALSLFVVAILHNPNRLRRITAFLDIEAHRGDGAYQLWQAILAFGAGGTDGVGLGNGRQQMAFLPEAHTDFIFAVLGEELGLVATLTVVALFALIFVAGLCHLRKAPNLFQFLLVAGCLLLVCLQAVINLGVVTGLLPTKGMSLPFISAGGSNLLLMGLIVGIFFNTRRTWSRPALAEKDRPMKEVWA